MIQIPTKRAGGEALPYLRLGRGDRPQLHPPSGDSSDGPDLSSLQHPQQLDLRLEREARHLVEKEGTPCGGAEESRSIGYCAGKCPPTMPEELPFNKLAGQRAAVNVHQAPGPATPPVNGLREQLFPCPRLADQENVKVAGSERLSNLHGAEKGSGAAENSGSFCPGESLRTGGRVAARKAAVVWR